MINNFRMLALPVSILDSFATMNDVDLKSIGAYWFEADADPCYPCRVSLEDAKIGERVLAMNFTHHDVDSPYRSTGPIFIRDAATQAKPQLNEIPNMLRHRKLSLRGYSDAALMLDANVAEGKDLEACISGIFDDTAIEYIHIHNAGPGCFNCSVVRV